MLKIYYELVMVGEQWIIEYINQYIVFDYGLKLEVVGVQDLVQVDCVVVEGQYVGMIYQYQWWFKQVVDVNGFVLLIMVLVFQWVFGIYFDCYLLVQVLFNGVIIVVFDDGVNQGQVLWLFQCIGLILFDLVVELCMVKLKNIVGNLYQFVFKELDLLIMLWVLNLVDVVIGYVL